MTSLGISHVLDQENRDPDSVTSLSLAQKAISDVSCLSKFRNLEKLELVFNNITSLEGLRLCTNLKWLSVVQNKLQSLRGIEGLTKLTVLNAGKNMLSSMNEVKTLVNLKALILNDNVIEAICGLDQMKQLNSLVLSRNPIHEIGSTLIKLKSIKKISLSNCKLEDIGSSLKSCGELKELRLAHNNIKEVPSDVAHNKRLQNLDLGNNTITRWSDIKALKQLVNLKNLNLHGNPLCESAKFADKVRRWLPNLTVLNTRPVVKLDLGISHDPGKKTRVKATETPPVKKEREEVSKKRKMEMGNHNEKSVTVADDVIDNGELSFMDLLPIGGEETRETEKPRVDNGANKVSLLAGAKRTGRLKQSLLGLTPPLEIGLGGSSTWDN